MEVLSVSVTNTISACGYFMSDLVLDHCVMDEKFYAGELIVKRFSGAEDRLRVTVPEKLMPIVSGNENRMVAVTGQIRSYTKSVNDVPRLVVTVFVLDISPVSSDDTTNEVLLDGTICRDPVYRTTPFGREICDLMIAVNRNYGKSDYIPCIAWGHNARMIGAMKVGDRIKLEGRLQSRVYQKLTPAGVYENRVAYEVSVFGFEVEGASA